MDACGSLAYYMQRTLVLAAEALEAGELPIAALVVLDGRIIAQGTTSEHRERRFLGHAELSALEQADRQGLSYAQRRATRLFTNLEPCLMCMGAAMSFFLGELKFRSSVQSQISRLSEVPCLKTSSELDGERKSTSLM